ncbi:MAG: M28 family peptidase [Deltaproteobacteria bacterium]|nr:M28 family peptidase [Deltaproteobacteria bacterium]
MRRSATSPRGRGRPGAGLVLACLAAACSSPPPPGPAPPPPERVSGFDAERAWGDARRIASYGSLEPGSRGARRARSHIRKQLVKAGVTVDELVLPGPKTALLTVTGTLQGQSSDVLLVVTALEANLPVGDEAAALSAASGPAAVLEIARALVDAKRPYTIRLAFVEGDSAPSESRDGVSAAEPFAGSRALATYLAEAGDLDRIRMAVWLTAPGRADLLVARDLRSHRAYREVFWESALALGETRIFADTTEYTRAGTGHVVFAERGMRRVVAISPRNRSLDVALPRETGPDDERRSRENMAAVGRVTLRSLEQVGERLQRIDGFARSPLSELPGEPEQPATASDEGSSETLPAPGGGRGAAVPGPSERRSAGESAPPAAAPGEASAD